MALALRDSFQTARRALAQSAWIGGRILSAFATTLSPLMGPMDAQAQGAAYASTAPLFTNDECRAIGSITTDAFKKVGADNLSPEFRQSMIDFIMASGKLTCGGSREIVWVTEKDASTFNAIASQLEDSKAQLNFDKVGVRLAASPTIVGSRPGVLQRRSEAEGARVK